MYPNPYQNTNPSAGGYSYPPPNTQAQHQQPPHVYTAAPNSYPAPAGAPASPMYPPPATSGYPPHTAYQPSTSYAPPASNAYPGGMMYPPPATQHGSPGYAPPASTGPYSAPPVQSPYGAPAGHPMPQAMPVPHQYGQPPQNVMSPPFSPVPTMPQQQHYQQPPTAHSATFGFQCGPLLRYQNVDIHQGNWLGSVMMVSKPEAHGQPAPVLTWSDGRSHPQKVTAQAIDGYKQSIFWRFGLVIPQDPQGTKKITYSINGGPNYWFFVAGRSESFRWMFYSCNGFSSATDSGK
ncbi:hypothetical protein BGZ68_010751 [Mortierella alpina]|nr:hypothetical protein BGZ68_010751 [Mortierella alpina]